MRIVAGRFRGRALAALGKGDDRAHLRPTTDRVREALFGALEGGRFGAPLVGSRVLDLFAGTGALGFEALSRGASHVTFVDDGRKALSLIRSNVATLAVSDETRVIAKPAARLPAPTAPCSLIFLDPPYGKGLGATALLAAQRQGWVDRGALIVWEEATGQDAPEGFISVDERRYGDTTVTFMTDASGDH